jgi:hypothetical protein
MKLTVYENTKEEYFTFITPECKKAIDFYLDMRSRYGEKLTDNSYLLREQFDIRDEFAIRNPKQVTDKLIQWKLMSLAEKSGIWIRGSDKKTRQNIVIAHGFRKFFTAQLVNSKLNPEIREMLLGHKIDLASAYYRPTEQEMLDEYMKAVNSLTINEENRQKIKVELLESEKHEITTLKNQVNEMKATMKDFTDLMKLKIENDLELDNKKFQKQQNEIHSIDKRLSQKGLEHHKYLVI